MTENPHGSLAPRHASGIEDAGQRRTAEHPAGVAVVINSKSGTVRTLGSEVARDTIEAALADWEGERDIQLVDGAGIEDAVKDILNSGKFDRIIVGGGDGTVASVAGLLAGTNVAMGILPMGTMNLMAKALGIDIGIEPALAELKTAERRSIDVARADGRIFLHHVSLGIQPRMVRIREKLGYSSRLTKILSSARAMLSVLFNPQNLRLDVDIDGRRMSMKVPALIVSNNIYEDSMWLKQARLDEGLLGIYAMRPMSRLAFLRLALDLLRGRWRDNLNIEESQGAKVRIEKRKRWGGRKRGIVATMDGEITLLPSPFTISIDPKALTVLVPRPTE